MSLSKTIQRELEVAFSKRAQAPWLRILKYVALGGLVYLFWNSTLFWVILAIIFILSLAVHFWVRYKTHGWTKSYGLWKHERDITNGNKS